MSKRRKHVRREGANNGERAQMRLVRKAAAHGWATPEKEKRAIITGLIGVFKGTSPDGKTAKLRSKLLAAKTLISADLRQQQLELEREIAAGTPESDLASILLKASEYDQANGTEVERERGDTPGAGTDDAAHGEVQ